MGLKGPFAAEAVRGPQCSSQELLNSFPSALSIFHLFCFVPFCLKPQTFLGLSHHILRADQNCPEL